MKTVEVAGEALDPREAAVYRGAMEALAAAEVPFLVGGAYAFASYTGIERHTKDFDLFLRACDLERALAALGSIGGRLERTFPHWLAKAHFDGGLYVDLIHSSGNGVAVVDELWFRHARPAVVLGREVRVCPAEEIVWSKAFVQERERYDGADVLHLLYATATNLDWDRLVARFGPHWRVLLSYLVLFGFVYPTERGRVPAPVLEGLLARLREEASSAPEGPRLCGGTLMSRLQYLTDLRAWGYEDARQRPHGNMTAEDLARWTEAGEREAAERGPH
jgi:hypothetical protein